MVYTVGICDADMKDKIIKILYNKYFNMLPLYFSNFNKPS